jgi:signal peptidase
MEPSIKTGSVVFIKYLPAERIAVGDIINFQNGKSITHRVVEVKKEGNEYIFITKGDTNNSSDINPVGASQVQGKVIFSIPYLGYLSFFMQTPGGFVLLVIIPAGLIVISEFLNIIKEHEKIIIAKMKKKENEDTNHVNIKQI